jgi:hypothetical protein
MVQGLRRDTALGHLLVVPLGNVSLGVGISMTSQGWRLNSHEGQWGLMTGASHYGLPRTNQESTHLGVALATSVVSQEYR